MTYAVRAALKPFLCSWQNDAAKENKCVFTSLLKEPQSNLSNAKCKALLAQADLPLTLHITKCFNLQPYHSFNGSFNGILLNMKKYWHLGTDSSTTGNESK